MFAIEPAPVPGPNGSIKRVIDHRRDAWLQVIGFEIGTGISGLQLVWGGRVIPFDAEFTGVPDGLGQFHFDVHIVSFGTSVLGITKRIDSVHFADDAERHQALMLAIEALTIYGQNFDGESKPDGYVRIHHAGTIHTKKDFGEV